MIHNRWHPDIPIATWVKPGDDFMVETYDWTGGYIKNNDSADDVRDIDLTTVHFLSGPVGVEGAEPGDLLVVDLLDIGAKPDSLWGFNGFFSKQNGGGFLTDHFPQAQKSIWDISGMFTHSRHVPGVQLRRPDPSRPDRLPARSEDARHVEQARSASSSPPTRTACRRWPARRSPTPRIPARPRATPRPRSPAEGARTVPPREHGGNCDIKDLSRGSKIYFPVYVEGAGLSMGDLHFSQGDGEITFCGAIEMAGWLHIKVDMIKGGMAKYGIKNPIFKPSPITPTYNDYLIFEGISVDERGQAALPRRPCRLPAGLPERDRVSEEVRLLGRPGLRHPRHRAGAGPYLRRGRHPERLRDTLAADRDLRLRHHAERGRPGETYQRRGRHPHVARQVTPAATGAGWPVAASRRAHFKRARQCPFTTIFVMTVDRLPSCGRWPNATTRTIALTAARPHHAPS